MKRYWQGLTGALTVSGTDLKSYGDYERTYPNFYKYGYYFFLALFSRSGVNIILSERFSFLLFALRAKHTAVVCHDMVAMLNPALGSMRRFRYRLLLRIMNRAGAIICISENTRKDLLTLNEFIDPRKVHVVSNGLEAFWFDGEGTKPAGFPEQLNYFLVVGTGAWNKNFGLVIDAMQATDPNVFVVKVGSISDADREQAQSLGILPRIVHFERVTDDELKYLYKRSIALIFPSLHEGFGWPPLEAMACGCPVIASNTSSVPEVCGKAAMYIDPKKVDTLTTAMRILRANPDERQRMIQAGRQHAALYTWKKAAGDYTNILNQLSTNR